MTSSSKSEMRGSPRAKFSTMNKTFFKDLVERAIKTFAQGLLGFLAGDVTILDVDWSNALGISGTMALASALMSLVSLGVADNGTASLIPDVVVYDPPGKHSAGD